MAYMAIFGKVLQGLGLRRLGFIWGLGFWGLGFMNQKPSTAPQNEKPPGRPTPTGWSTLPVFGKACWP